MTYTLKNSSLIAAVFVAASGQVFAGDATSNVVGEQLYPTKQPIVNGATVDIGNFKTPIRFTTETVKGSNELVLRAHFRDTEVDVAKCHEGYFPHVGKLGFNKKMSGNASASCEAYNPADVASTSGQSVSKVSVGDIDYTVVTTSKLGRIPQSIALTNN